MSLDSTLVPGDARNRDPAILPPMPGLLILRHAQSTWNAEGRWQGHADPDLSSEADAQIRVAANRLAGDEPFDLVVTSDLTRARQTAARLAQALALDAPHYVEAGLREYDIGEWSGLTHEEIGARWPGAIARFSRSELAAPGGEDRDAFDSRVSEAGRRVAALAMDLGSDRVLVVAHGGVVRSLARSVGRPDLRVGHLAGYRGRTGADGLFPEEPVDLLEQHDLDAELSL